MGFEYTISRGGVKLDAAGLYGVMAFDVTQCTRELAARRPCALATTVPARRATYVDRSSRDERSRRVAAVPDGDRHTSL